MSHEDTSSAGNLSSIRLPTFTGQRGEYVIWAAQFMARARPYDYVGVIDGTDKVIKKSEYLVILAKEESTRTTDEKKQLENYEKNSKGYDHLVLAIDGKTTAGKNAFHLVNQTKTTDLPGGDLKLAWDNLKAKYSATTPTGYITKYRQFMDAELGKGENPDNYITRVETLVSEANAITISGKSNITNVDTVLKLMTGAKDAMYNIAVNEIQNELEEDATKVSVDHLRKKFRTAYDRNKEQEKRRDTGKRGERAFVGIVEEAMETMSDEARAAFIMQLGTEQARAAMFKQFKGNCNGCGLYGHKKSDCPNEKGKQQTNGAAIKGKCFYCDKIGHKKKDCYKRKADLARGAEREVRERTNLALGYDADATNNENGMDRTSSNIDNDELRLVTFDSEGELVDEPVMVSGLSDGSDPHHPRSLNVRKHFLVEVSDSERPTKRQRRDMVLEKGVSFFKDVSFAVGSHDDSGVRRNGIGKVKFVRDPRLTLKFKRRVEPHKTTLFAKCITPGKVNHGERRNDSISGIVEHALVAHDKLLLGEPKDVEMEDGEVLEVQEKLDNVNIRQANDLTPICDKNEILHSAMLVPRFHTSSLPPILEGEEDYAFEICPNERFEKILNEKALRSVVHNGKKYEADYTKIGIGDSGASCNFCPDMTGMFNVRKVDVKVDGEFASSHANYAGEKLVEYEQKDGSTTVRLQEWFCLKESPETLCSFTKFISEGAKVFSDIKGYFHVEWPDGDSIIFDRAIKTQNGWVPAIKLSFLKLYEGSGNEYVFKRTLPINYQDEVLCLPKGTADINDLHERLGHPSMELTRVTANKYGIALTGKPKVCTACLMGKAKRKNLNKVQVARATKPGERMSIDITSPKPVSYAGNKHMLLALDDYSDVAFSFFIRSKSDLSDVLIDFIIELKDKYGIVVKIIRCDNAGENRKFEQNARHEGLALVFEYTAPNTPQQNGRCERKIATVFGRMRAMLVMSPIKQPLRERLWCEAANTATYLDRFLVDSDGKSKIEKFLGKGVKAPKLKLAKSFGQLCVVTNHDKHKAKLADRGKICIFLGYAIDHSYGTYRLYNPKTQRCILSRDVTFIEERSQQQINVAPSLLADFEDSEHSTVICTEEFDELEQDQQKSPEIVTDDEDEDELGNLQVQIYGDHQEQENDTYADSNNNLGDDNQEEDQEEEDTSVTTAQAASNPRVIRAMRRLESSFNPDAQRVLDAQTEEITFADEDNDDVSNEDGVTEDIIVDTEVGRDDSVPDVTGEQQGEELHYLADIREIANTAVDANNNNPPEYVEPSNFWEAWNHPDPVQRVKWRAAIRKEYGDMKTRVVWEVKQKSMMPKGRRCVKCKWVFKIKRNGTFRARLVACGYSQIPGVDFTANYSPVINDSTFRFLILLLIYYNYSSMIVDVETAFLYGQLEEEIYMDCPIGYSEATGEKVNGTDNVLLLLQCIYGLVQAARQYYKHMIAILRKLGFTGGEVDPCLFVRKTNKGMCFIGIYVDDNLLIGDEAAIQEVIADLKAAGLVLKIEGSLHDYLSCEIAFSNDRKKAWLGQPHLIKKLETTFGNEVKSLLKYLTPGTPGRTQVREMDKTLCLTGEKQTRYRSGVGMLLYLTKHSRPDIANAVRELCKVLDGATEAAYKEMLRIIKYVLDSRHLGLRIEPQGRVGSAWNILAFTDSDYAKDPETRRSISGYVVYIHGVPIAFKTAQQKSVTLSSAEAEWVALSEAVKEIKFLIQLCENVQIKVELPVIVRVDNNAAIFMSKNVTTTSRTKHVDVRTKFVRELQQDGVISIKFVRSEDNISDILTKNLGSELHNKHSDKLVCPKYK